MATSDLTDRLGRTRHRIRRWLLRHRRGLAALLLAVATVATLRTLSPAPPEQVDLLVAAADLAAGAEVSAADVTVVQVPRSAVPDGAQRRGDVVGRTLAGPVRRGEPMTDAALVATGMLKGYPGRVALPVRVPDPDVVALLQPGDEIDVVATDPSNGATTQVAAGARVVTVPDAGEGTSTPGQALPGRLVVLAVSPSTAKNVAGAAARGYLSVMFSG